MPVLTIPVTGKIGDRKHCRAIQRRLPTGRAWNGENQQAVLCGMSQDFVLSEISTKEVADIDNILYGDNLSNWQEALNLLAAGTTEDQELAVARKLTDIGGMRAIDIQNALQGAGFDLYVYKNDFSEQSKAITCGFITATCGNEAFQALSYTEPVVLDPRNYINYTGGISCGYTTATCGHEDFYPLAGSDGVVELVKNKINLGEEVFLYDGISCGYTTATCGHEDFKSTEYVNFIPEDVNSWRYVFFVCGPSFPQRAQVSSSRRSELRQLLLEIKPLATWAFLFVDYI